MWKFGLIFLGGILTGGAILYFGLLWYFKDSFR